MDDANAIIRRREAATLAHWSIPTLARRERTDPTIPPRISTGPNGKGPYGYRRGAWLAYLDALPRNRPAATPTPAATAQASALLAKRRQKRSAAECLGVESKPTAEPAATDTPSECPLDAGSVSATAEPSVQARCAETGAHRARNNEPTD